MPQLATVRSLGALRQPRDDPASFAAAFGRQRGLDLPERQTVHDVLARQPPFPRDADAEPQFLEPLDAMRVGIDDAFHSFFFCERPPAPVEIETFWGGVDLNPSPGFRGGFDDCRNFGLESVSPAKAG